MSFVATLADAFTVVFVHSKAETAAEIAKAAASERHEAACPHPIEVRRIGLTAIRDVLAGGIDDLRHCRTESLTIAVIYPICGLIVAGVIADRAFEPFLFPLGAGFALIGPLVTLWFAALSRQRELTGDAVTEETIDILHSPHARVLKILGGFAILLFLGWNCVAALIYELTLGRSAQGRGTFFPVRVFTTGAGWEMIVIGCGVGAVFAVVAVAVGCISFPLALDRAVTAREAIKTSVDALIRNPLFMLCWGAVIVAMLILGAIPGLLGLAIVLPVLGHATWHIYRRIVV